MELLGTVCAERIKKDVRIGVQVRRGMNKRLLYTICFIALNLLDFVRNTQNGDIWSVAANCTGLVMMIIVGSAYARKDILNPFFYVWSVLCAGAIVAVACLQETHIFGIYKWALVAALLNVWWLGLFVRLLGKRLLIEKSLSLKPGLTGWIWLFMSVFMIFSVSGRAWPLWFLLMFGIFYITRYSQKDMFALLNGMVDGTILTFFILQIYAYGFRPYDQVRYVGAFSNCNITALHYLIVYAMVLFKLHILHEKKAGKFYKLIFFIGAGGLLSFQFLTMGRTAWVCSILLTLLYGILVMRKLWKKKWKQLIGWGAALVLCMVCTFPLVFGTVRWLPTVLHHPVWYAGEYSEDKVHSFDTADSWKYVEMDEFLEAVFGRISGTFRVRINNPFVLKAYAADYETISQIGSETMDPALRIRLSIYKAYLDDMTWFGNPQTAGHYQLEGLDYFSWHAQNVWLQMAYSYGIPAGILFVILTVVLLRKSYLNIKGKNVFAIVPFFICVIFFGYGTMEMVWNTGQLILLLIFFVQHPQICDLQTCDLQTTEIA